MSFTKAFLSQVAARLILVWAVGCIFVGILFSLAIDNWHPGYNNHPWDIVIGCLAYFALIVPIVWLVRRKPAKS